ncbi:MAG: SEC-C metal-binding domain-containing protein, partial [Negativicutes bacterium]|nr:SEC-C metal-binding domain-containing protein [Negativicutes bacterium]
HEAYEMFQAMTANIQDEIVRHVFRVKVVAQPHDHLENAVGRHGGVDEGNKPVARRPVAKSASPGRNELCSCGSGRKYKRCCGQ